MGGAIARGLLKTPDFSPSDISIIDKSQDTIQSFNALGVEAVSGANGADIAVVALKPWLAAEAKSYLDGFSGTIVSVMAGISLSELSELYGTERIVRVMPNTAVALGQGVSFVASNCAEELETINSIFSSIGISLVVTEDRFDAYMALGSCGLAYALRYVRAATSGAVELGVRPVDAVKVLSGVLRGTAALLESGRHPEELIDEITTPAGITIKGLNAMEDAGFTASVIAGLRASKV